MARMSDAIFDRAAGLADRILKGAKPADLPLELPTRFQFASQPEDRKGDRSDHPGIDPAARRRCDRMSDHDTPGAALRPRRPLFQKYFDRVVRRGRRAAAGQWGSEAWFGYRDQRASCRVSVCMPRRVPPAGKIQAFLDDITDQLQWTVQLPWREGIDERHRFDVLRLMRQVPAVVEVTLVDGNGVERLHVSRVAPDIVDSGIDHDRTILRWSGARATRIWYGPVTLYEGSEPHMTIAVAGSRSSNGVTVAVINLKLIWDVISAIHVGQSGDAFVLDQSGRLVAHPDISLVLRGDDDPAAARLRELQQAAVAGGGETAEGNQCREAGPVIAATAPIPGPGWTAFVEQPAAEAFDPICAALWRTGSAAGCRRDIRRVARLSAGAPDGRADPPAGAGRRADRRRQFRPQDRDRDR